MAARGEKTCTLNARITQEQEDFLIRLGGSKTAGLERLLDGAMGTPAQTDAPVQARARPAVNRVAQAARSVQAPTPEPRSRAIPSPRFVGKKK